MNQIGIVYNNINEQSQFIQNLLSDLDNQNKNDSDENQLYYQLISNYAEIPIEMVLSAGSLLYRLHKFSEKKIIEKIKKDEIPLVEFIENSEFEIENPYSETETKKIIKHLEDEFDVVNDIVYNKFRDNKEGYSDMNLKFAVELFNHTINRLKKQYINSKYCFKYTICKTTFNNKIKSINLVLIKK